MKYVKNCRRVDYWKILSVFFFILMFYASRLQLEAIQRKILGRRAMQQAKSDKSGTQSSADKTQKPIVTVWRWLLWLFSPDVLMIILLLMLIVIVLRIYLGV